MYVAALTVVIGSHARHNGRLPSCHDFSDYPVRIDLEQPGDLQELHDIEPSLAPLVLGDERLRPGQFPGQLLLRQPGGLSGLDEPLDEDLVSSGVNRFSHACAAEGSEAPAPLIPIPDYPKIGFP